MKLDFTFFNRPCLEVANDLVGKVLVRKTEDGEVRLRITETEAYCGEEDTACHAHKGKTKRTEVMYMKAGTIYVYLCYGMHWLLNIVTGEEDKPEAVLIRACEDFGGPAKLTKKLSITGDFNRKSITDCKEFYIEDDGFVCDIQRDKRVGINYATEEYRDKLWRFIMKK
ncbi:MAG: DNA-3-methyladenine glycosylase [Ruminococcaceae bacterium]|nr:DNA-3-methyladenine glycosylase [Oscillospiraceae bacterium]